ncbi:hypothetical protein [Acidovorax sp.]|uniref:hypothetical protein n=1 Tax=Acidovorax sp. TaxID=1872122 RepID=UPI00391F833C
MNQLTRAEHRNMPVRSQNSDERPAAAPRPSAPPEASATPALGKRGLSVGQKLAASFAILGLAVALLGTTTWLTGQSTSRRAGTLANEQLPIERAVHGWKTQSVHTGQIALRASISQDVFPLVDEMRKLLIAEGEQYQRIEAALSSASTSEITSPLWEQTKQQRQRYAVLRDNLMHSALESKNQSKRAQGARGSA